MRLMPFFASPGSKWQATLLAGSSVQACASAPSTSSSPSRGCWCGWRTPCSLLSSLMSTLSPGRSGSCSSSLGDLSLHNHRLSDLIMSACGTNFSPSWGLDCPMKTYVSSTSRTSMCGPNSLAKHRSPRRSSQEWWTTYQS